MVIVTAKNLFFSLTVDNCFGYGYVEKQAVTWEKYWTKY